MFILYDTHLCVTFNKFQLNFSNTCTIGLQINWSDSNACKAVVYRTAMIALGNMVPMFLLALLFVFIPRIKSTTTDGE